MIIRNQRYQHRPCWIRTMTSDMGPAASRDRTSPWPWVTIKPPTSSTGNEAFLLPLPYLTTHLLTLTVPASSEPQGTQACVCASLLHSAHRGNGQDHASSTAGGTQPWACFCISLPCAIWRWAGPCSSSEPGAHTPGHLFVSLLPPHPLFLSVHCDTGQDLTASSERVCVCLFSLFRPLWCWAVLCFLFGTWCRQF